MPIVFSDVIFNKIILVKSDFLSFKKGNINNEVIRFVHYKIWTMKNKIFKYFEIKTVQNSVDNMNVYNLFIIFQNIE